MASHPLKSRLTHNAPLCITFTPHRQQGTRPILLKSYSPPRDITPVRTADFDFHLPDELIAQHPASNRETSRMLVLHRAENQINHHAFSDLPDFLRAGDVLVLNNSRVIPARLRAENLATGGGLEILLLEENAPNDWWAMMHPAKRAPVSRVFHLLDLNDTRTAITATVLETNNEGHRRLGFSGPPDLNTVLDQLGEMPLPPYIKRETRQLSPEDRARYQTVYARDQGSVAAPTAGLHFSESLLDKIRGRGVEICPVTLHVGLGTFAPVKAEQVEQHVMHHERFEVTPAVAEKINAAKTEGRRVIAVGTTSVRVLESLARQHDGKIVAGSGRTNIFLHPPTRFQIVDALITNFHLPKSTLLMLVSAFAASGETQGREMILAAYAEAVQQRYRFFSYGDAMLIL